jgi:hypothetical protein
MNEQEADLQHHVASAASGLRHVFVRDLELMR